MEGAWIISRPLSAVGGKAAEDSAGGAAAPVMQLSDFTACLEAIAVRSPDRYTPAVQSGGPTPHPLFVVVPGDVEPWERAS